MKASEKNYPNPELPGDLGLSLDDIAGARHVLDALKTKADYPVGLDKLLTQWIDQQEKMASYRATKEQLIEMQRQITRRDFLALIWRLVKAGTALGAGVSIGNKIYDIFLSPEATLARDEAERQQLEAKRIEALRREKENRLSTNPSSISKNGFRVYYASEKPEETYSEVGGINGYFTLSDNSWIIFTANGKSVFTNIAVRQYTRAADGLKIPALKVEISAGKFEEWYLRDGLGPESTRTPLVFEDTVNKNSYFFRLTTPINTPYVFQFINVMENTGKSSDK